MRRLRLLVLTTGAILAASIAVAAASQAAEFRALPEKLKFSYKANEATEFIDLGLQKLRCAAATGTGAFTSERLGTIELKLTNCEDPTFKFPCMGLGDTTAGNVTIKAEFHLRHLLLNNTPGDVSLMLLLGTVHINCNVVLLLISGSVCSDDVLTEKGGLNVINLLRSTAFMDFLQTGGDAVVTSVDTDNSLAMEECKMEVKEDSGASESGAVLSEGTLEKFQNAKGEAVTGLIDLSGTP
jgi:hypothetical protein